MRQGTERVMDELRRVIADRDTAYETACGLLDDRVAVAVSNAEARGYGTLVLEVDHRNLKFLQIHSIVSQMRDGAMVMAVLVDDARRCRRSGRLPELLPVLPTISGMPGDDGAEGRKRIADDLLRFCMDAFDVREQGPVTLLESLMAAVAPLPGATLFDVALLLEDGGKAALETAVSLMPEGETRSLIEEGMGRPGMDETLARDGAYLSKRLSRLIDSQPFADPGWEPSVGDLLRTGHIVLVAVPEAYGKDWLDAPGGDPLARLLRRQCLLSFLDLFPDSQSWCIDPVFRLEPPDEEEAGRLPRLLSEQASMWHHVARRSQAQARLRERREYLLRGDIEEMLREYE